MKKLAIAAAIAAMAGSAAAQNVTVYGVVDTAMQHHNTGSQSLKRAGDNLFNTSRLGFQGTEDLGGGLRAVFVLESQLNPATGSQGSTTVAANETFNREARVGFVGSFGDIRFGRQDVSYAQDIDIGVSQFGNFGNRPINGTAIELGTDQKNVVKYVSPTIGGLQFQIGRATNAVAATTDAGTDQTSAHVRYDLGKLALHAGWQKTDGLTADAKRDFTAYGAAYDFGFASVGYSYAEGDVSTTGDVKSKSHVASARVPLTGKLALHGVYGQATDGTKTSDGRGTGYTVGVSNTLSKRTMLYAAYTAVDNQDDASMYMRGQEVAPTAGKDTKTMSVGISHVF